MWRDVACAALVLVVCLPTVDARAAKPRADEGVEPITQPSGIGSVRWVVIEENAAKAAWAAPAVDCSKFELSQADVARYLGRARRITEHDFNHMVTWLPCHAAGRAGFTDDRHAAWSIREDGAAWLRFDGGEELFLCCPRCRLPHTGSWLVD